MKKRILRQRRQAPSEEKELSSQMRELILTFDARQQPTKRRPARDAKGRFVRNR
jgi:hypothetical protein